VQSFVECKVSLADGTWGDTCGGNREFTVKAFLIFVGHPNGGNQLKFEAAYPLVMFFVREFF
jgi:hypothetical protein